MIPLNLFHLLHIIALCVGDFLVGILISVVVVTTVIVTRMTVRVDGLRRWAGWPWRSCHLTADTAAELRAFAARLGLPLAWEQKSRRGRVHFDLSAKWRRAAVAAGAVERRFDRATVKMPG